MALSAFNDSTGGQAVCSSLSYAVEQGNDMRPATAARPLPTDLVASYRSRGFCLVDGLLTPEECTRYRDEELRLSEDKDRQLHSGKVFRQRVNIWRDSPLLAELTLHPLLTAWATQLAGVPLRLWHDHALVKEPHNGVPTEFHQDQPYWPHSDSFEPISAWIALQDVPPERGCMSFIPGSHRFTEVAMQNLGDPRSLFEKCPAMEWMERVTVPIKAGSVTFHHGRTAHRAYANDTDEFRVAHTVIYMPRTTRWDGREHAVVKTGDFQIGDLIQGELFPPV
jgi:hypothetical protein